MEEGLWLSEEWANSNEAVCSDESCLAMAHSSKLLQVPGCQKPSIVPDSPAGLTAMDHGAKISSFSQMKTTLTSSSLVFHPPPQTFPLIKSSYFPGYRVMEHRVASSFLPQFTSTKELFPSLSHELLYNSPDLCLYVACIQSEGWRKSSKFSSKLNSSLHHSCHLVKSPSYPSTSTEQSPSKPWSIHRRSTLSLN